MTSTAERLALRYNGYHPGLGRPRGPGADPYRAGDAVRGVLPALLDAGGDDRADRGAAHPRQGARGGAGPVPGPLRAGRPPAQALQPPAGVAGVRHRLGARHPLLLPRLAVRRGRRHSGGARGAGAEPHPAQALPRGLSGAGARGPRLRLPRPPGARSRISDARHLLAPRRRARALPHRLPVQLAPGWPRTRWTRSTACSSTPG